MIVIFGYGEQGKAIAQYILKASNEELLTIDVEDKEILDSSRHKHFDMSSIPPKARVAYPFINSIIPKGPNTTIVNCLPTEYIKDMTGYAIALGNNIVDLGGVVEVERKQQKLHDYAREKGSTVITAAGIAPGITSAFVKYFSDLKDAVGVKIFCGGIPKFPDYPLGYIRVFNESGVIKEYSGVADEIYDGEHIMVPSLSDREHVFIPSLGVLEADITTGGISTTLDRTLDLDYFSYKTLRYPGHFDYVKRNILSQRDPEYVLSKIISPVSASNPDILMMRLEVEFDDGTFEEYDYFWEYDKETGLSAMAQATGYAAAEVALQAAEYSAGVYNMDIFNPFTDLRDKIIAHYPKAFRIEPIKFSYE